MKKKCNIKGKIYRKIYEIIILKLKPGKKIRNLYPSYWHRNKKRNKPMTVQTVYYTQIPNEGAGIGHQIANYNCGLYFSGIFRAKFVYPGFRDKEWENFLGFGEGEVSIKELKNQGYKTRTLPFFFDNPEDMALIQKIVDSYRGEKVILLADHTQFYYRQYDVIPYIKEKFESANARTNEMLIYDKKAINIAVHIRRGDINSGQTTGNKELTKRWLDLDYYKNILEQIKNVLKSDVCIYLFSQGKEDEFRVFEQYGKVVYCLDMDEKKSFLHMVRADVLIMSKSSFSYKPALLSDGIRICPPDFWHGYPEDERWIKVGEDGRISQTDIEKIKSSEL